MNRLTAIGLASLAAYGLLIASKYTGVVSAARHENPSLVLAPAPAEREPAAVPVAPLRPAPEHAVTVPMPVLRPEPVRASPVALEFRASHDLKAFTDALMARRDELTADERYHLAKALEECQFATSINEDLVAYGAKQRRAFLASLPAGDPLNARRIAAYEAVDNSQRCARFQGTRISAREIEDLYAAAAQQGDPRAQARILVAELNKSLSKSPEPGQNPQQPRVNMGDMSRLISLLETRNPEAVIMVGQFLAQSSMASQLRVGPNGEVPEPSAFLGAFSLVACDLGPDCTSLSREPQMACAYAGYCNATSYEELYQNFLASPWAYAQAVRYRGMILTALNTGNWSLIGLQPPGEKRRAAH